MSAFTLTANPAILSLFDAAKDKEREALAKTLAALAPVETMLSQYAEILKTRETEAARAGFETKLSKYSLPKTIAALALESATLGLGALFLTATPGVDGAEATFALTLAPKGSASGKRSGATGLTFRGVSIPVTGTGEALKSVPKGDPLYSAAQLALSASGKGNISKVFRQRGWVLASGKVPSEKSNYNAWQALKALARLADGPRASELKALKGQFKWTF